MSSERDPRTGSTARPVSYTHLDVYKRQVLARALGALFVRSYERGERVHLAMVSRGYQPNASRR